MDPIRYAGVIAFLDWLRRSHSDVRSLRSLTKEEFLDLATEYEGSKGLQIGASHKVYQKWGSTHYFFSRSASDAEALDQLKRIG